MCGLCGILEFNAAAARDNAPLIQRMTAALRHRGPDDEGTLYDGAIALGHRRLSVIDLSRNGRQPMSNEDGTVFIVYNGEVYNFRELRAEHRLSEKGHVFRSQTDTEVLLHLYEELGPQMATQLVGMFAIAIWDARRRELHLVRDRYGIKPLFYHAQDDRLLFASEIKSILLDGSVSRRVNRQALHDYLTLNYVPGTQTVLDEIRHVPPAHWMTVRPDGGVTFQRYWDLRFDVDESIDEHQAVSRIHELLEQAVRRRLLSDLPVGVLLSGGMDSSAILAVMRRLQPGTIHTFSIGFDDPSFNELPYARLVAGRFQTCHHDLIVTPELVREMLPEYLKYIDEPYGDGSAIPTYYVCRLAREHVGVVLSGEGGDEAFAGYDTHAAWQMSRWFRRVPRVIRNGILAPLARCLPVSHRKLSFEFRLKRFLAGQDLPAEEAHLWWRIVLSESEKMQLYSDEMLEQFAGEPTVRHFQQAWRESTADDELNRLLYIDSTLFLPSDLMIKNDRMSMAHSLEARVPLTDHELTGYLATVPPRLKLRRLRKKHLLRAAMRDDLPASVRNKRKVGLEMPYSRWLKHELNDLLNTWCHPGRMAETGLFRADAVQRLIEDHVDNRRDNGRALWGLMNFMMWREACLP